MYDIEKEQFSKLSLAPAHSRSEIISFEMMDLLHEKTKNQRKLSEAWPYLKHGEIIVSNNGSFHEYDLCLTYRLTAQCITDIDLDFVDQDDDNIDSEYYSKRYNSEEDSSTIYFLPDEEYEYFINMDQEDYSWYVHLNEESRGARYYKPVKIESLTQLLTLMDTEMIRAIKFWEMSRENYQEFFDQLGARHLRI